MTLEDFFHKVCEDYERLAKDIADLGLAMNCILWLYHLHEWVWSRWLKGRFEVTTSLGIHNGRDEFRGWLQQNCPHYSLLRELADGLKHCDLTVRPPQQVKGFGQGPYGVGPYGTPYLLIDLGENREPATRYLIASTARVAWRASKGGITGGNAPGRGSGSCGFTALWPAAWRRAPPPCGLIFQG